MLEIGSLVDGKYKILNKIGQGGMSVVYMAINEKANKTWAVKEVRKDGVLDFEAVKQGLVAETDILKKLSHPNLPSIIDVIDRDDSFIIIMDYVQGNSLNKALEESGAQPQEDVIEWAKQLCDVLGYLHSRTPPIIYRDMKPSNIMLKPDGNIALIDFGTAREFKEKNLADTTCLGTVGYAAPEQFGGMGQTDARTDIYCLGATLYHLVTGRNPSEPPYEIKPIREVNPALSGGLEKIIKKCTQRDPNDRYQLAAELMYDLEHYEEIDETHRRRQKRKLRAFLATAILTVVMAVAGVALGAGASSTADIAYDNTLQDARDTSNYDAKEELYKECIAIPGQAGRKDAYLELIEAYAADHVFTVEEANEIERLISNNREALQEDRESYAEICFETGRLYWFWYDYGKGEANGDGDNKLTKATSAKAWFGKTLENITEENTNWGMARVYYDVGNFYSTITDLQMTGEDRGVYKALFDNLTTLLDTVAVDSDEVEVVRLETLELARSALQQYATKFKRDEVPQEELTAMAERVEMILDGIDTDLAQKVQSQSLIEDTKEAIRTAYGTTRG